MRIVETGNADSPITRSPSRKRRVGPVRATLQQNTGTACGGGGLEGTTAEIRRLPGTRDLESGGTGGLDVRTCTKQ